MFQDFGHNPDKKDCELFLDSENYREDCFHNKSNIRVMSKPEPFFKMLVKMLNKPRNTAPPCSLPSIKRDLTKVSDAPAITWFGHSSYLLEIEGKRILVDPVFSGYASPFTFMIRNFTGSNVYKASNMPDIDVLIITHDHYDHMDFKTLKELRSKVKSVICPLGVGSHLRYWGFEKEKIQELDWWNSYDSPHGFTITATPAQHFSGRTMKRGQTLWASFVLKSKDLNIFIGGDSGYNTHFKTIGERLGPFDIAILETGQYNEAWAHIHMMPEETVQASLDLQASYLLPVHWAKFSLAFHAWDDPIERVTKAAVKEGQRITTPIIGEQILLNKYYPNTYWWRDL